MPKKNFKPLGISNWESLALFKVGVSSMVEGDYERARLLFVEALNQDANNRGAMVNLAIIDYIEGDNDQALDRLSTILRNRQIVKDADWFSAKYYYALIFEKLATIRIFHNLQYRTTDFPLKSSFEFGTEPVISDAENVNASDLIRMADLVEKGFDKRINSRHTSNDIISIARYYRYAADVCDWKGRLNPVLINRSLEVILEQFSKLASSRYFQAAEAMVNNKYHSSDLLYKSADLMDMAIDGIIRLNNSHDVESRSFYRNIGFRFYGCSNYLFVHIQQDYFSSATSYHPEIASDIQLKTILEEGEALKYVWREHTANSGLYLDLANEQILQLEEAIRSVPPSYKPLQTLDKFPSVITLFRHLREKKNKPANSLIDQTKENYYDAILWSTIIIHARILLRLGKKNFADWKINQFTKPEMMLKLTPRDKLEIARYFVVKANNIKFEENIGRAIQYASNALEHDVSLLLILEKDREFDKLLGDENWQRHISRIRGRINYAKQNNSGKYGRFEGIG
jgi:hypothetical protein